ncbi:MAG: AbrB/MazE/SpoVT family DNA-binding domain-containing protein [Bacillota bacterium]
MDLHLSFKIFSFTFYILLFSGYTYIEVSHVERLKLKVSPKGQITLPKILRQKLSIGNYVYLNVDQDKVVLEPVSLADEFDDMIVKEVRKEGYNGEEAIAKIKEKKRALLKALDSELKESIAEAESDWAEGNTISLWPRKE